MARGLIDRALRLGESKQFRDYEKRVETINRFEPEMELLEDAEIRETADELRERVREGGESLDDVLPEAFALCREASRRTLGQRHYDVQLIGGMVLHSGAIAEMRTGEGKTLTATLAVFLNTLAGDSVHVITVNDYLARRDAEWMSPIYDALGVTVGVLQDNDLPDHGDRRHASYAADVTYGTNSEFGFDYLRDNMAPSLDRCFQRERPFGIVDEVDNILIDEARTPLIISGSPEAAADLYYTFARLAKGLEGVETKPKLKALGESKDTSQADYDYEYDEKHKTVAPTERGVEKAEKFLGVENLYLSEHGTLVNHLVQSLKAESLYRRDKDYAVVDGEVMIIDEHTGRILEGRRWSEGLHQAVEAKEGLAIREENQTLATITLQNYFRMYDKLSGMTGTALTEATEFMKIYKMPVVEIPTNRDMIRDDQSDLVYKTEDAKFDAVCEEIADLSKTGRPVLVVPPTVHTSPAGAGVVIGWAETREARRAVSDALPFLQRARHVSVAHVYAEGERESACRCVDDVVAFLDRHKIKAEAVVQPRTGTSTAKQLVAIAREKHAGLIVMGGYGHARLREWAFGGVTREMLKASPVCLLLSH